MIRKVLYSSYAWACLVVGTLAGLLLMVVAIAALPRDRAFGLARRIARIVLAALGIRVRRQGADNMVAGRSYIVMGNHVSFLDLFLLAASLPSPVIGLEKAENFDLPLWGWLTRRWGNIPVIRQNHEEAMRAMAEAREHLLGSVCSLVIFPEGTRTKDGQLGPFKRGGFHLAIQTNTPILPVTLEGAYAVHPTGTWLFAPGSVEVVFHTPIDPAEFGPERLDDLIAAVRQAILPDTA